MIFPRDAVLFHDRSGVSDADLFEFDADSFGFGFLLKANDEKKSSDKGKNLFHRAVSFLGCVSDESRKGMLKRNDIFPSVWSASLFACVLCCETQIAIFHSKEFWIAFLIVRDRWVGCGDLVGVGNTNRRVCETEQEVLGRKRLAWKGEEWVGCSVLEEIRWLGELDKVRKVPRDKAMAKKKQKQQGYLSDLVSEPEQARLEALRRLNPQVHRLKAADIRLLCGAIGDPSSEVRFLAMERLEEVLDRDSGGSDLQGLEGLSLWQAEELFWGRQRSSDEFAVALSEDYEEKLLPLLLKASRDGESRIRAKAGVLLGRTAVYGEDGEDSVRREVLLEALCRLLGEEVDEVRRGAEEGWVRWDCEEGDARLRVLLSSADRSFRDSALVILWSKRDQGLEGVEGSLLLEALGSDELRVVRAAVGVIAEYERVEEGLIEALLGACWRIEGLALEDDFQEALLEQGEGVVVALVGRLRGSQMASQIRAAYLLLQAEERWSFEMPEIPLAVWEESLKDQRYRASACRALVEDERGEQVVARCLEASRNEEEQNEILDAVEEEHSIPSGILRAMLRRLGSWSEGVRLRVVEMLLDAREVEGYEDVVTALEGRAREDDSEDVREMALVGLVRLKAEGAVLRLVERQIQRGELSYAGVEALSSVKCEHPMLLECLRAFLFAHVGWEYHEALSEAFRALGGTGDPAAISVMLSYIEQYGHLGQYDLLSDGIVAFGEKVLPLLAEVVYAKKPNKALFAPIFGAFAKVGTPASLMGLLKGASHRLKDARGPSLVALQEWPGERVSEEQRIALRMEHKDAVAGVLCERLRKERSKDVLASVVNAAENWGEWVQETAPHLRALLAKEESDVFFRSGLLRALRKMRDAESFSVLLQLLDGEDRGEMVLALQALQKSGLDARSAIPALVGFLERTLVSLEEDAAEHPDQGEEDGDSGSEGRRSAVGRGHHGLAAEDSDDDLDLADEIDDLDDDNDPWLPQFFEEEDDDDWDSYDDMESDLSWERILAETVEALGTMGATEAVDGIVHVMGLYHRARVDVSLEGQPEVLFDDDAISSRMAACMEALCRIGVVVPALVPRLLLTLSRESMDRSEEQNQSAVLLGDWGIKEAEEPMLRSLRSEMAENFNDSLVWKLRGLCGVACSSAVIAPILQVFGAVDDMEILWEALRLLGKVKDIDGSAALEIDEALGKLRVWDADMTDFRWFYDESPTELQAHKDATLRDVKRLRFLATVRWAERIEQALEASDMACLEQGLRILAEDMERVHRVGLFLYAYRFERETWCELDRYAIQEELLEEMVAGLAILAKYWGGERAGEAPQGEAEGAAGLHTLTVVLRETLEREQRGLRDVPQSPRACFSRALGVLEEVERVALRQTLAAYRTEAEEALFGGD